MIESHFPEPDDCDSKPCSQGWDKTALLVNNDQVFRFPHRQIARFRTFYHGLNLARYTRHIGNEAILEESLVALKNVL